MVSHTSESTNVVSYLLIDISNDDLVTQILISDAFCFHIVNFPDLSGSIPIAPAYGTYILQLIRYSPACHNHDTFSSRHSMVADRLFSQGFSARKLRKHSTNLWVDIQNFYQSSTKVHL